MVGAGLRGGRHRVPEHRVPRPAIRNVRRRGRQRGRDVHGGASPSLGPLTRGAVVAAGPYDLFFLPGASGDITLWSSVAAGVAQPGKRIFVPWPGLGGCPADHAVAGLEDLVRRLLAQMTSPCVLFAQSMGGVIALEASLARPELVRGLVLSVTSGGLDVQALGAEDWRPDFAARNPSLPRWFLDARRDLTPDLGRIDVPVLLLWGDADPISPVAVGQRLASLLPRADLVVVNGGTHDLARERAAEILPAINRYLAGLQ